MKTTTQIEEEMDLAIAASSELLSCLHEDNWEAAERANQKRMRFVRLLSKCQKNSHMWQNFGDKVDKLKCLDKEIIKQGKDKHSKMLSAMCDNHYRINGCVQYSQHK